MLEEFDDASCFWRVCDDVGVFFELFLCVGRAAECTDAVFDCQVAHGVADAGDSVFVDVAHREEPVDACCFADVFEVAVDVVPGHADSDRPAF